MSDSPGLTGLLRETPIAARVEPTLTDYARAAEDATQKQAGYAAQVNRFYDIVTDFYEYGWGQSFHFACRFQGETHREAMARREHKLAALLGLRPGMRVLDVGCGVGGPMRSMARFSGATIVGINNNDFQVGRAEARNRAAGLEQLCSACKGDFMAMPFEPGSFDAAFSFEATCHAPSIEGVYAQIFQMLKPGGVYACLEWCKTPRFDPENRSHRRVIDDLVVFNGVLDLSTTDEALAAARSAGFEVTEANDIACQDEIPWYEPLAPRRLSLASFRCSRPGRWCVTQSLGVLELLRVAPRGSRAAAVFLCKGGDALLEAGEAGIFTPDFLMMLRKPSS